MGSEFVTNLVGRVNVRLTALLEQFSLNMPPAGWLWFALSVRLPFHHHPSQAL